MIFHLVQTDYNVGLYRPRRIYKLLRRRLGTTPKLWMDQRLRLFGRFTVPSMRAQSSQDWSWIIRLDPETPKEDIEAIKEVAGETASFTTDDWSIILEELCEDLAVPLLTTRLDNDDLLRRSALAKIQLVAAVQVERCLINLSRGYSYDSMRRKLYLHDGFFSSGEISHFASLLELTPPFSGIQSYLETRQSADSLSVIDIEDRFWVQVYHRCSTRDPVTSFGEAGFEELQDFR